MTFNLEELLKNPCPNLWHDLLAAGKIRNGQVTVPDAIAVPLLQRCNEPPIAQPDPVPVPQIKPRSQEKILEIESICNNCSWNLDWTCQHPGCKVCPGRAAGKLKELIRQPASRCPMNNW